MSVRAWGQLFVQLTAPDADPVMVGSLWSDTTASLLKRCTSISPITFVSTEGGSSVTPAALTKVDDTNVTLTLGGTPATALLQAASVTVGWTGTLAVARGGIGVGTLLSHGVLVGQGTGAVAAAAVGTAGQLLVGQASADPVFKSFASNIVSSADPTGTTSSAGVMMGLAFPFTPTATGRVILSLSGDMQNNGAGNTTGVIMVQGTGTAPANGVAQPGGSGQVGGQVRGVSATGGYSLPFCVTTYLSLAVGTTYWFDLDVFTGGAGTSSVKRLLWSAAEI